MASEPIGVEFTAEVRQVKTMADYTVNITLNLPEDCREQAKQMIDWQGDVIQVIAVNVSKAPGKTL